MFVERFRNMSAPPCAVDESKGLYPSVQGDPAVASAPGSTAVTYYPSGPPQQQPQQFVVAKPAPVVVQTQQPPQSFVCHILLSCLVVWCCFCPCGFLAFILASKISVQSSVKPKSHSTRHENNNRNPIYIAPRAELQRLVPYTPGA